MSLEKAEQIMEEAIAYFFQQVDQLEAFLEVARVGDEGAHSRLYSFEEEMIQSVLEDVTVLDDEDRDRWATEFARRRADEQVKLSRSSVRGAGIVFIHSMLDAALVRLCEAIAYLSDPPSAVLERYLKAISFDSLPVKIKHIGELCSCTAPSRTHSTDTRRINEFHELRNQIVHHGKTVPPTFNLADELHYMNGLFIELHQLVCANFGLLKADDIFLENLRGSLAREEA